MAATLAVGACGKSERTGAGAAAATSATPRSPEEVARRLSDAQLAGQRIIYSYAGSQPPESLLSRIRKGEAAGVIFFAPNVPSRSALHAAVQELQLANQESPAHAPLLLMTDQEGGQVRRLPGPPEDSEKQIGNSVDGAVVARSAGRAAAANLASVGLNVNLAPVLDVYRESGDFIDEYERSYGRDPARVGKLGAAFIAAQQAAGVAATAKHFPGLGAATRSQNTDERPVVLDQSLSAIRTIDEAPYRPAIAVHVRLVMLSWAIYPALDPTRPAGLSPTIVQGELRSRLGFKGLTITDSLEAGALEHFGGLAKRALLAARAGDDLILASARHPEEDTPAIGAAAQSGISSGITTGQISKTEAERIAASIIELRREI